MSDLIQVKKDIEGKITLLEYGRDGLEPLAIKKAQALSNYDKVLGVAILKLKDEGKLPATLIEKIAKSDCHRARYETELADAMYKIQIVKMKCIETELNGFQSIFRHLEER